MGVATHRGSHTPGSAVADTATRRVLVQLEPNALRAEVAAERCVATTLAGLALDATRIPAWGASCEHSLRIIEQWVIWEAAIQCIAPG